MYKVFGCERLTI